MAKKQTPTKAAATKKARNTTAPNASARAREVANPNARFMRTSSPSTRTKAKKSAPKRMPTTYRTQAARARARSRYAGH